MAAASETLDDASADPKFLARILEWYGEPQNGKLKIVGSIYKNKYGVWDLHGNVWEWVSDFNSNFISGESREDSPLNKDMFCGAGGQAGGNKENYAAFMRFAFRSSLKGTSSTNNLDFRCMRSK
jgi:formylglycine-generating enzyme required for sulfatase activity